MVYLAPDAGIGRVAQVKEFEVANVESLRLGRDADKIACTVDPAGYFWEVLERHERNVTEALCKVLQHMHQLHWFACSLCVCEVCVGPLTGPCAEQFDMHKNCMLVLTTRPLLAAFLLSYCMHGIDRCQQFPLCCLLTAS